MINSNSIFLLIPLYFWASMAFGQTTDKLTDLTAEAREHHIQKALQLREIGDIKAAIDELDVILAGQSNDARIILFKGDLLAQSGAFAEAASSYKNLLSLDYKKTLAQINLSYALFMMHKPARAFHYAEAAWMANSKDTRTIINYFNALLWNVRTREAATFLTENRAVFREDQLLVMEARLNTAQGNYREGLAHYDKLVNNYPDKNYAREYIEVLLARKEISKSYQVLEASKALYPPEEFQALQKKIEVLQLQKAGTSLIFFRDIAQNTRIEWRASWQQKAGQKYRLGLRAGLSTLTSPLQESTKAKFSGLTINSRWSAEWSGQTDLNLQQISFNDQDPFATLSGQQSLQYQPTDRQTYGVFFRTEILNYTAALVGRNTRSSDVGYRAHIMLSGKWGTYSQGHLGRISDGNRRWQFFGSVYRLFNFQPILKAGVNLSTLHFQDNRISSYFSPDQYLNSECFLEYRASQLGTSPFYLHVQTGAGWQIIEKSSWDATWRLQVEGGIQIKRFAASVKYQTSNTASSTGTGYRFDWLTCQLRWEW
jgi:tetratricopeptide (TPR) repeat protein